MKLALALITSGILSASACAPGSYSPPPPCPVPRPLSPPPRPNVVRSGQTGALNEAALFIADAKGFFQAQGITHEPQPFSSPAEMIAPLAGDELDVGVGVPSASLFNAIDRGAKLRIVADNGSLFPGHGYEAIVVRKTLAQRVESAKDMKGLRISIAANDTISEYSLDRFLRSGGLTIRDIEVAPLTFPDMVAALAGGTIDVAVTIEPYTTRILEAGSGVVIKRADAIVPNAQNAVILYSDKFAQKRDVAVCWMVAYIKGARFFSDAFDKKDQAKRREAVDILSKATKVDVGLFERMILPGLNVDGRMNVESLGAVQQYFVAKGSQTRSVDLGKVADLSFADAAVRALGPYR